MKKAVAFVSLVLCVALATGTTFAVEKLTLHTAYVPATYMDTSDYDPSGIVLKKRISITQLNIRNVDLDRDITVTSVNFYGPDGQIVKAYLPAPEDIGPLASITFYAELDVLGIPPYDRTAGQPSFIVKYESSKETNAALIQSVAITMTPGPMPGTTTIEGITSSLGYDFNGTY
jgi:hypothetical protein